MAERNPLAVIGLTFLIIFAILIGMVVNELSFSGSEKFIIWIGILILIGSFFVLALREFL